MDHRNDKFTSDHVTLKKPSILYYYKKINMIFLCHEIKHSYILY